MKVKVDYAKIQRVYAAISHYFFKACVFVVFLKCEFIHMRKALERYITKMLKRVFSG